MKEDGLSGLADQGPALNVKAAGYSEVDAWSAVYKADDFGGAVTIVGPDARELAAKQLASQAHADAAQSH